MGEGRTSRGISRRAFLGLCAAAGAGLAGAGLWARQGGAPPDEQALFLRDVGGALAGRTLRVAAEPSPLSAALAALAAREFTPQTGIAVEWTTRPLAQLLDLTTTDLADRTGAFDLYDWDQAWLGQLAPYAADLRPLQDRADLAYPGYDAADLLPELQQTLARDGDRLIGLPFDAPLFVLFYRRDLLAGLGLAVPRTLDEYQAAAAAIQAAHAPQIYGTAGQWAAGHYALLCESSAWIWGHGGAFYGADGRPTIADAQAEAGLRRMLDLGRLMPPGVAGWDWWDAADSFMRGEVGLMLFWNSFMPLFADSGLSQVAGKVGVAPLPLGVSTRPAAACGFGERPGLGRMGGSTLAISRDSRSPEAAWLFLQWAGSPSVHTRAAATSGATPIRRGSYAALAGSPGLAHLPATLDTITGRLGSEPRLPAWPDLAVDGLAGELGWLVQGAQDLPTTLRRMHDVAERAAG